MTFWTGELNDPHRFNAKVGFYDTTLRDGEQTVGVVLSPEDKLELARGLDELGIERIEAGFPRVSKDDWRAVELIRDAGLNAEVWGFSRAVEADVKALVELGVQASVIESPISDLKLAALGVDREAMLERIVYAISFAVGTGRDGSRSSAWTARVRTRVTSRPSTRRRSKRVRKRRSSSTRSGLPAPKGRPISSGARRSGWARTCRSTFTVTTTSAWPPRPLLRPCEPARVGSREP